MSARSTASVNSKVLSSVTYLCNLEQAVEDVQLNNVKTQLDVVTKAYKRLLAKQAVLPTGTTGTAPP